MRNDEAINWLKLDISMMKFDPDTGEEAYLTDYARNVIHAEEMAIEALKSKWIPVSDRVPEDDRLVIVCTESGQVYTDYYFDDNPEFWELAHIIAWQDLPKAYKEEKSE
jgi:hypothetical protein